MVNIHIAFYFNKIRLNIFSKLASIKSNYTHRYNRKSSLMTHKYCIVHLQK